MKETSRRRLSPDPPRRPNPIHRPAYAAFCSLLLSWREGASLTQRELAERMKRPLTWVHKTETGARRMDPLEWLEWVHACGLEPGRAAKEMRNG